MAEVLIEPDPLLTTGRAGPGGAGPLIIVSFILILALQVKSFAQLGHEAFYYQLIKNSNFHPLPLPGALAIIFGFGSLWFRARRFITKMKHQLQ